MNMIEEEREDTTWQDQLRPGTANGTFWRAIAIIGSLILIPAQSSIQVISFKDINPDFWEFAAYIPFLTLFYIYTQESGNTVRKAIKGNLSSWHILVHGVIGYITVMIALRFLEYFDILNVF